MPDLPPPALRLKELTVGEKQESTAYLSEMPLVVWFSGLPRREESLHRPGDVQTDRTGPCPHHTERMYRYKTDRTVTKRTVQSFDGPYPHQTDRPYSYADGPYSYKTLARRTAQV